VFRLSVKDDDDASRWDEVQVTVKEGSHKAPAQNVAPVADAGPDKTITLPVNQVELAGIGNDVDGKIVSFSWTKTEGGNAMLSGNNTATLKASDLQEGIYVFRLSVKDDKNAWAWDEVRVTVNPVQS